MSAFALQWLVLALDASIKAVLIALVTGALLRLLKTADSNVRHRVWMAVLVGMIVLPALSRVVPALTLPLHLPLDRLLVVEEPPIIAAVEEPVQVEQPQTAPAMSEPERNAEQMVPDARHWTGQGEFLPDHPFPRSTRGGPEPPATSFQPSDTVTSPEVNLTEGSYLPTARPAVAKPRRRALLPLIITVLPAVWAVGTAALLLRLITGLLIARWMVGRTLPIEELSAAPGVRECPLIHVPLTVGALQPTVLLPPVWREWSPAKLCAVLAHERMHIERGDCGAALLAEINQCIYWFHPLAWWLKHELASLAEAACDDAVIDSTGDRTGYARHLLEVAAAASGHRGRLLPLGVSMARKNSVETRIHSILDFTRPLSQRLTWTRAALLAALMLPLIALAAALQPSSQPDNAPTASAADSPKNQTAQEESKQPDSQTTAGAPKASSKSSLTDTTLTFSGSVIDDRGQRVAGANISFGYLHQKSTFDRSPPVAVTDGQGKFQFSKTKSELIGTDDHSGGADAGLIATKDGYGFAIGAVQYFDTSDQLVSELTDRQRELIEYDYGKKSNVLTLVPDDMAIRGQVLDSEGRPVTGAKIEVASIWRGATGNLDAWHSTVQQPGADDPTANQHIRPLSLSGFTSTGDYALAASHLLVVPPVRSDAEGFFTLRGIGRDRIAQIYISGPTIATLSLKARSRPGETIRLLERASHPEGRVDVIYPAEFKCIAGPSVAVTGRVTDRLTGQALAGYLVRGEKIPTSEVHGGLEAMHIRATTDADGRYRLEGLPLGENSFQIVPPKGSRHLVSNVELTISAGTKPSVRDVALAAGVKIRGRVTDSRTGQALLGTLSYFVFLDNPALKDAPGFDSPNHHYRTDREGRYEIPVLPGPGILAFMADNHRDYPRGAGAAEISGAKVDRINDILFRTQPYYCNPHNTHLVVSLDPAPDAEEMTLDLTLTGGASLTGRIRTADGQPLGEYYLYGQQAFAGWNNRRTGETFQIQGYLAEEGRRIMVYHPERNLVGLKDLTGPLPTDLEIVLVSGGTITGRVLDADGLPLENLAIGAEWGDFKYADRYAPHIAKTWGELPSTLEGRSTLTDKNGRLELPGLIPGLIYSAGVTTPSNMYGRMNSLYLGRIFEGITVESGQTKDLGDLKITPRETKKPPETKIAAPQANATTPQSDESFTYVGTVVDSQNQPVPSAEIRLDGWQKEPPLDKGPPAALTDQQGKFRFTRTKSDFREGDGIGRFEYASLVVTKPGYGIGIANSRDFETTGRLMAELSETQRERMVPSDSNDRTTIKLVVDDVPIEGRIVNTEGQPVAGALVEVTGISAGRKGSLDDWLAYVKKPGGDFWSGNSELHGLTGGSRVYATRENATLSTKTDDEGRFTIRGLGRERIAGIFVSAPGIETSFFRACSRPGEIFKTPATARDPNTKYVIFYPNQFTHAVGPSQPIEGRVTDKKSGKPLAGQLVKATRIATNPIGGSFEASYIRTVTDADGRYRLSGLPLGDNTIQVLPPEKSGYLLAGFRVTTKASDQPLVRDMEVMEGIHVHGRVTDSRTGKPLFGRVQYFAFNNNPHLKDARGFSLVGADSHYWLDKDGNYAIPVLPGSGILTFMADQHEHYARGAGVEEIDGPKTVTNGTFFQTSPYDVTPSNFHLLKGLNLAPETEEHTLDLMLTSGMSFTVRLLAADGQPISNYYIFGEQAFGGWHGGHSGETFDVKGYLLEEGRRVMVYHPARNLVGLADVTGPAPKSLDIELRPGGTIRGRVVDNDGSPLEDLSLYAKVFDFYTGKREQSPAFLQKRGVFPTLIDGLPIRTDKDGRFEIRGLVAGLKYTVGVTAIDTMNGRRYAAERGLIFTDVTIELGQTKDLGDLRIVPRSDPIPEEQAVSPEKKEANSQPAKADAKQAKPQTAPPAIQNDKQIRGRVIDAAGKPVAGAKLLWFRNFFADLTPLKPKLMSTTGADGQFNFALPADTSNDDDSGRDWESYEYIIVNSDVHGFAKTSPDELHSEPPAGGGLLGNLINAFSASTSGTIRLPAVSEPIRGRLVNVDGQPVVGATVKIRWFDDIQAPRLSRAKAKASGGENAVWQERVNDFLRIIEPVELRDALPTATTDASGRFELRNAGANRLFQLLIQGDDIESVNLVVRSLAGEPITIPPERNFRDKELVLHPRDFVKVLGPSKPVTGRVADLDTGEPIPGAIVRAYEIHGTNLHSSRQREEFRTHTDAQGRYRITGLPIGAENSLVAFTNGDIPYIPVGHQVDTSKSSGGSVERNFGLKRGVWAVGRVYDDASGKPFNGQLEYYWFRNRQLEREIPGLRQAFVDERYWTNKNGEFRVPVLPSRGILAFRYSGPAGGSGGIDRFARGFGGDAIEGSEPLGALKHFPTLPHYLIATNYERVAEVNPQPGQPTVRVDMPLFASQPVKGRVVNAEGLPATGCEIYGLNDRWGWQKKDAAEFVIDDLRPIEKRKIFAFHRTLGLAGGVIASHDASQPLEIKLSSAGRVIGRLVDADGEPITDAVLHSDYDKLHTDNHTGVWANHPTNTYNPSHIPVDAQGRFQLDGLVPGWTYSARATASRKINGQLLSNYHIGTPFDDLKIEPGEKKDLGDVRLKQEGQVKQQEPKNETKPQPAAKRGTEQPPSREPAKSTESSKTIAVKGRVVDADDRPIPGAKLFTPFRADSRVVGHERLKEHGASDAAGEFTVAIARDELPTPGSPLHPLPLIAMHPGYGTKWIDFPSESTKSNQEIVLQTQQLITGRLVNTEGQPVAGAKVEVHGLMVSKEGDNLDSFLQAWKQQVNLAPWYATRRAHAHFESLDTTTDADGRFTVHGIGPEQICQLEFAAPDVVIPPLWVVNRGGFNAREYYKEPSNNKSAGAHMQLAASGFTHVCLPDFKLTGRVTTDDGQPARGVRVHANSGFNTSVETVTDDEGNYRLAGLARIQRLGVSFVARNDRSLLPRNAIVTAQNNEAAKTLDVILQRGVTVSGRVVDAATGKGVRGSIWFVPLPGNDFASQWEGGREGGGGGGADSDGNFKAIVMPGPGVLMLQMQNGQVEIGGERRVIYRQADFSPEDAKHVKVTIDGKDRFFTNLKGHIEFLWLANAVKYVNFAPGSTPPPIEMHVDSGKTVDVEFADADGQPVANVFVSGITESWPMTAKLTEPRATIYALGANRPRHFVAVQRDRGLSGALVLTGGETSPVRITMQKSPSIRGRAVDVSGQPLAKIDLAINFDQETANELLRFGGLEVTKPATDSDGRFEIANLPPNESFNLDIDLNGNYLRARLPKDKRTLTPAREVDLGDVVFGPIRPATKTPGQN